MIPALLAIIWPIFMLDCTQPEVISPPKWRELINTVVIIFDWRLGFVQPAKANNAQPGWTLFLRNPTGIQNLTYKTQQSKPQRQKRLGG